MFFHFFLLLLSNFLDYAESRHLNFTTVLPIESFFVNSVDALTITTTKMFFESCEDLFFTTGSQRNKYELA